MLELGLFNEVGKWEHQYWQLSGVKSREASSLELTYLFRNSSPFTYFTMTLSSMETYP